MLAAVPVALAWVFAMSSSIPDRGAVAWEMRGEAALTAGRFARATSAFEHVLELSPDAGRARRGLACMLWAQGNRSGAAVQLELTLEDGFPLPDAADCGARGSFAARFRRYVAGATTVFVLPHVRARDPQTLRALHLVETPNPAAGSRALDASRLVAAGCIAWRVGYRDLGYQYAELAGQSYGAGRKLLDDFMTCIGRRRARDIHCASIAVRLGQCQFRGWIVREFHRDERWGLI